MADDHDNTTTWKQHPDCAVTSPLPLEHSMEVWCGDEAVKYLRGRDKGKPFFAYVCFERPHDPLTVPEPYDRLYDPAEVTLPANAQKTRSRANQSDSSSPYVANCGTPIDRGTRPT